MPVRLILFVYAIGVQGNMANRSLIFSLDKLPGEGKLRIKGLSESEYSIPLIYRILVSVNPQATHSIIWKTDEKIAITTDYAGGVAKLADFFERLPKNKKDKKDAEKVLKFLNDEANAGKYIHLECGEIFEMEDEEPEVQNTNLIAELSDIDNTMDKEIKCITAGDRFALQELPENYWTNILYFSPGSDD